MNPRIQIIAVLGSVAIILLVFQLIRQRKLREAIEEERLSG